jgi:hypothetical protein
MGVEAVAGDIFGSLGSSSLPQALDGYFAALMMVARVDRIPQHRQHRADVSREAA